MNEDGRGLSLRAIEAVEGFWCTGSLDSDIVM